MAGLQTLQISQIKKRAFFQNTNEYNVRGSKIQQFRENTIIFKKTFENKKLAHLYCNADDD